MGSSEENYRIREVAEIVSEVVPGSVVKYAEGGGPDLRCYRVDCGKIARTLPEFKPQWTVRRGVEQLYTAYRRYGLTEEEFLGTKYLRIKHVKSCRARAGSTDRCGGGSVCRPRGAVERFAGSQSAKDGVETVPRRSGSFRYGSSCVSWGKVSMSVYPHSSSKAALTGNGSPMSDLELSVVIPCYNEEDVLPELYRRVTDVFMELGRSYEVIIVNDGSHDRTWPVLVGLAAEDPHIVAVKLSRNHGHQLALTAGLSICRGKRVLILDADLQDPPELLPEMLRLMDEKQADVVFGQRRSRTGETAFKLVTASLFYRLIDRLADVPLPQDTGDFRLMSRRALDVLLAMPERHRFIRGMVSWIGFRQEPLLYDRSPRFAGTTKYPFRKMLRFATDAITSFSIKPLALASWLGIASGLFAFALVVYSLVSWLGWFGRPAITGWTSLMAAVAFLGSVQLLVLGIFGEYLGRMYEQSKDRPLFIIERIVRSGPGTGSNEICDFGGATLLSTQHDSARRDDV